VTDRTDVDGPTAGWQPVPERPDRRRQLVTVAVVAGAALLAVVFAITVLPRWWAHRIGDRVDGRFSGGVVTGLALGTLATFAALLVARLAFRRRLAWKRRGLALAGALALASPNLTTLGIVVGRGGAAHAGERTLDVEAPGFRGATLVGVLLGVAAFVGLRWLLSSRRRSRREVTQLRDQLRDRDGAPPAP
jgi:MFS family permease